MTATEHFEAGRLAEAIAAQLTKVKAAPTDQRARLFLFELFLFTGELDRARKQLDVLNYEDPQHTAAVEQFRSAMIAEEHRRAVFAGQAEPQWLVNNASHLQPRLEALRLLAQGDSTAARTKLDEANAAVPVLKVTINGKEAEGIFDADERFGTLLEVFGTGGVYCWVALEDIASITLGEINTPRSILWRPANLVLHNGIEGDVLLPNLYPNTHLLNDDELRLGKATDWHETNGFQLGQGNRMLIVGGATVGFNTVKFLQFDATAEG